MSIRSIAIALVHFSLKCVCQTDEVKHVAWESNAAGRDADGVPKTIRDHVTRIDYRE